MNLNYSINGVTFLSLGIGVSDSSGVVDALELKEPFTVNWPEANGIVADLLRPRYEARTIKLDCFMIASGPNDLILKTNALFAQLVKPDTQRLRFDPVDVKPLVFEVYSKNGIEYKKKWRDAAIPAQFTLTLIEPQPIKWVLTGVTGQVASIRVTAPSPLVMYWGDGTKSELFGTNITVTHTYGGTTGTVYYAILSGELQRCTIHQKTNLTELWPRLL